jgi:hypothetical protein
VALILTFSPWEKELLCPLRSFLTNPANRACFTSPLPFLSHWERRTRSASEGSERVVGEDRLPRRRAAKAGGEGIALTVLLDNLPFARPSIPLHLTMLNRPRLGTCGMPAVMDRKRAGMNRAFPRRPSRTYRSLVSLERRSLSVANFRPRRERPTTG